MLLMALSVKVDVRVRAPGRYFSQAPVVQ